jgi:peptide/nickel transport system ATP-binding protein
MSETAVVEEKATDTETLMEVRGLRVHFPTRHGAVQAVADIDFDVRRGETLSIVGESGSGKSTTARALLRLEGRAEGSVRYQGRELTELSAEEMRKLRPDLQMIFQDPIASLNPRMRIEDIIAEGLSIWPERRRGNVDERVDELLRSVGMNPTVVRGRRPTEFSGGQCQRIAIARALAVNPTFLVCDEPVSALDVSVQAQVLNVLRALKAEYELTVVFISHDLSVVRNVSDRVLVLYLGKVCEIAPADTFFAAPLHPYSRLLLESAPGRSSADLSELVVQAAEPPSPMNPPSGCRFRTRCPLATDLCAEQEPALETLPDGHQVACHHVDTMIHSREER